MAEWYTIRNVENLDTPALVIYPDRVKKNIELLKTFTDDPGRLRPHVKTNKCPQIVRLMLEADITKFKCATIAEAEMLATEGAKDVLLAYQPVGPKALRFCDLQRKFPHTAFSCLIDNPKTLSYLSALATDNGLHIAVFIDLNIGMNRTGVAPGPDAFSLYELASAARGISFIGLHAYDGHLRDADLGLRKQKCDDAFIPVETLARKITEAGNHRPLLVVGGTPTFPIHAKRKGVEASPGTFIFWDKGYQQLLAEQPFHFAALVVTRVISRPDTNILCLDLGHKSIASENPINQRVYFLNATDLVPIGHSEEHMVFTSEKTHAFSPGDVLYGVPHHICPTVALYDQATVCQNGEMNDTWPIVSRKRKLTI